MNSNLYIVKAIYRYILQKRDNMNNLSNTLIYQNDEIALGDEQFKIAKGIITWLHDLKRTPYIRLSGYAGTGKTIVIAYIIQNAIEAFPKNMRMKKVAVCTYTWKAALVLKARGVEAQSIHSIFYKPMEKKQDKNGKDVDGIYFAKRSPAEIREEYSMIIIDEASMVSTKIREDIEAVGLPVLYVGDENQLPPIEFKKKAKFSNERTKEFMEESEFRLTQIRRQALDSPIIRLSIDVREGKNLKFGKYGNGVFKIEGEQLSDKLLLQSDQLLCGKNITRNFLNKRIRKLKGYSNLVLPHENEKLIGLNNLPMLGLYNGQTWLSGEDYSEFKLQYSHKNVMSLISDDNIDGEPLSKVIVPAWFPDDIKGKSFKNSQQLSAFLQENSIYSVDFGYAITVHKSQGSSYKRPIIFEEYLGNKEFHRKWLYTAVTRAEEKLIIVSE